MTRMICMTTRSDQLDLGLVTCTARRYKTARLGQVSHQARHKVTAVYTVY